MCIADIIQSIEDGEILILSKQPRFTPENSNPRKCR